MRDFSKVGDVTGKLTLSIKLNELQTLMHAIIQS